jgi:transcriptional repressor NrdR
VQCPKCASDDDKVVDSRAVDSGRAIRRRRACLACGNRFTTFERIEGVGLTVEKRSGDRMPFDPDKIAAGVRAACKNRPVSDEAIGGIVEGIEDRARVEGLEVLPTERIGLEVLEGLGALDQVAYLRFASVYRSFDTLSDIEHEIA